MSEQVFAKLLSHYLRHGEPVRDGDRPRFIKRHSEADAEMMSKADVSCLSFSRNLEISKITFASDTYFVVLGFPLDDADCFLFPQVEMTPALFQCTVCGLDVQPRRNVTGSEIRQALEDFYIGKIGYEGHELVDISTLFPSMLAFKDDLGASFIDDLSRIAGLFIVPSWTPARTPRSESR